MAKTQMQKVKAIMMDGSELKPDTNGVTDKHTHTHPPPLSWTSRCAALASFLTVRLNPWQEVRQREEMFVLAQSLRVPHHGEKAWVREPEGVGHVVPTGRKQRAAVYHQFISSLYSVQDRAVLVCFLLPR